MASSGTQQTRAKVFERLARHDFADLSFDSDWLFLVSLLSDVCAFLEDTQRAAKLYELLLPYAGCNVLAYPSSASAQPRGIWGCLRQHCRAGQRRNDTSTQPSR